MDERKERERILADERLTQKLERQKKVQKSKTVKKARKKEADWDEWQALQREENLAKKLKKGKISQQDFDTLLEESVSD